MTTTKTAPLATPAQVSFMRQLLEAIIAAFPATEEHARLSEAERPFAFATYTALHQDCATMTKARASSAIDSLKATRDIYQRQADKASRDKIEKSAGLVEDAMYAVGEDIFRTRRSHSSGVLLAYKLTIPGPEYSEKTKASWDYLGRADRFIPAGSKLLERDEATAWGRRFGYCSSCRAKLTKHESIDRGMGPKCYGAPYTPGYVSPRD